LLERFSLQGLANTLYGCCLLGIALPSAWILAFSAAVKARLAQRDEQESQRLDAQGYSNIMYAVTVLSLWDFPDLKALWQRNLELASSSDVDERGLYQLFLVYLVAEAERPGLLAAPSAALLEKARRARHAQTKGVKSSDLHKNVSACLTVMGIAHANEQWCKHSEHSIDIALNVDSPHRVALEVDGPTHFLQNRQPNGRTRMRDRLLKGHGWRVAVVDGRAWRTLRTQTEREAYLTQVIEAATAAPLA
jgi:very-short-patch-repair endonuclease